MATYEAVLDALADPTRRGIVEHLRVGPAAVGELAGTLPVSRPAVSQHLRILLDAGLVTYDAKGTRNFYRLDRVGFDELRSWLDAFWHDVMEAFESYAWRQSESGGSS